ncbi:MAG: hypothetical protein WB791_07605 [Waddliaceae bacterium]
MTAVSRSAFGSSLIPTNNPLSAFRENNKTRLSREQENAIAEVFERVSSRVIERVGANREQGSRHEDDTLMHIKAVLEDEFKKNVPKDLWARLSNLESGLSKKNAEITKLRNENSELKARHAEEERFAGTGYEWNARMIAMLSEEREKLNNRIAELDAKIGKLFVKNKEGDVKIADLSVQFPHPSFKEKRLINGKKNRNALINKLSREKEELNHRCAEITDLEAGVARNVAEKNRMVASIAWHSAEIAKLSRERQELYNRIAEAEAEVAKNAAEKNRVDASIAMLSGEKKRLADENRVRDARIAQLSTQIDEQNAEKQKFIAENQAQNDRISELSDRIAKLNREREELDGWDIVSKPD